MTTNANANNLYIRCASSNLFRVRRARSECGIPRTRDDDDAIVVLHLGAKTTTTTEGRVDVRTNEMDDTIRRAIGPAGRRKDRCGKEEVLMWV